MNRAHMTPELLDMVAARFKVLSDASRLAILQALRAGEKTVTELVEETGLNQANASRHLQLLHTHRFVKRRREGLFTYYGIANRDVFRLCDIMCGRLEQEADRHIHALR